MPSLESKGGNGSLGQRQTQTSHETHKHLCSCQEQRFQDGEDASDQGCRGQWVQWSQPNSGGSVPDGGDATRPTMRRTH